MDKLQPILRHKFWILAGLIIPLAMFGFYSANAALKEATTTRESELTTLKSQISNGKDDPNEHYTQGLTVVNRYYEESVNEVVVDLWKHQQEQMVWPESMAKDVPADFMTGEFSINALYRYKSLYPGMIEELEKRIEPVMPDLGGDPRFLGPTARTSGPTERLGLANRTNLGNWATGTSGFSSPMGGSLGSSTGLAQTWKDNLGEGWDQKVILGAVLPQIPITPQDPLTSPQVWNAQMDLWLTRMLIDAIVRTNEGKDSVSEAVVRRVDRLYLIGGDGKPVLASSAAPTADAGRGRLTPSRGNGSGSGSEGLQVTTSVQFEPAEEFGSALASSSSTTGTGILGQRATASVDAYRRYIGNSDAQPFWERGFYMSVIIQQSRVPEFVTELTNAPWPTRVVRFNIGPNTYLKDEPLAGPSMQFGGRSSSSSSGRSMPSSSGPSGSAKDAMRGGGATLGGGGAAELGASDNGLASNLPGFAEAALQNRDLVQLDLCGVITIYKEPKDAIAAMQAAAPAPGETAGANSEISEKTNSLLESVEETPVNEEPDPEHVEDPQTGETLPEGTEVVPPETAPGNGATPTEEPPAEPPSDAEPAPQTPPQL